MTADEMLSFDNNLDTNIELNNIEIYDLISEKIYQEKEHEKETHTHIQNIL